MTAGTDALDRVTHNYTSLSLQQYNQFVTRPQTFDLVPTLVGSG